MSAAVDDLLRDLAAELAVEPSPALAAQARARARQPGGRRAFTRRRLALAVLLTSGFFLFESFPGQRETRSLPTVISPQRALVAKPLGVSPSALRPPRIVGPVRSESRMTGRPITQPETAEPQAATSEIPPAPLMIVPADQAIALRRILDAMRSGPAPVPPAVTVVVDADGRLPAPAAIEIPEITIEQLLPPASGGGSRDRK